MVVIVAMLSFENIGYYKNNALWEGEGTGERGERKIGNNSQGIAGTDTLCIVRWRESDPFSFSLPYNLPSLLSYPTPTPVLPPMLPSFSHPHS